MTQGNEFTNERRKDEEKRREKYLRSWRVLVVHNIAQMISNQGFTFQV